VIAGGEAADCRGGTIIVVCLPACCAARVRVAAECVEWNGMEFRSVPFRCCRPMLYRSTVRYTCSNRMHSARPPIASSSTPTLPRDAGKEREAHSEVCADSVPCTVHSTALHHRSVPLLRLNDETETARMTAKHSRRWTHAGALATRNVRCIISVDCQSMMCDGWTNKARQRRLTFVSATFVPDFNFRVGSGANKRKQLFRASAAPLPHPTHSLTHTHTCTRHVERTRIHSTLSIACAP
jgi:hypothetical protein